MKIILPKPKIICPECGAKDIAIDIRLDYISCNSCGKDIFFDLVFEEEPHICNCDICKKIKGI